MMEIRNIPPFWNALAYWLGSMFYLQYTPKRWKNRLQFVLVSFLFFFAEWAILWTIKDWQGFYFNMGMVACALITGLHIIVISQNSIWNDLYYAARAFIAGGFTSSFAWQMYTFFSRRDACFQAPVWEVTFMLAFYAATRLIFYILERTHSKQMYEMNITPIPCLSAMAISFLVYVLSSLSFSSINTPFGSNSYMEAFNYRTIFYLAGVAMLYAHHIQLCESYLSLEKTMLQNMLNMQYTNYQMNQESVDIINHKYHDLKHQIAILRSEIPNSQKTALLDQLENEISVYEAQNKTGNKYLDTILTGKSIRCQREKISMTCVADGALLDFLDLADLSVIFGNALDNAIEAVVKLESTEERLIHLKVSQQKGFVCILVENRTELNYEVENCFPGTSKMDTNYHGFGLKSISRTVEKYNGSMTVYAKDGWFELRILLPLARQDIKE